MNSTYIRNFMVLCESLNFSDAARKVQITQAALSMQISILEKDLGVMLFTRNRRTTQITAAGKYFYEGCKNLIADYQQLRVETQFKFQGTTHPFTIGTLDYLRFSPVLMTMLSSIKDVIPSVEIRLLTSDYKGLLDGLREGSLDAIISTEFDTADLSGFMYHSAGQIKNCIALSRAHRLANRKMVRIRELKNETFLSMAEDETPQLTELLHRACQEASFDPILQTAESYQELINIITKGLGIYLLNTEHYMYDRPELHYVGIEDLPDTTVHFVWNPVNNNEIIPIMLRTIRSITE